MTFAALAPIAFELDRAEAQGRPVSIWWRDDDAVAASPALDRLLALAAGVEAHPAIAVIPARLQPSLAERLAGMGGIDILVHGLTHANHARDGEKSAEFGPHRPLAAMRADLRQSLDLTRAAFGSRLLAVFVPPWNRISPAAAAALPSLGYRGLSAFGGSASGSARLDTHLDVVDWHGGRGPADPALLAAALRRAIDGPAAPIGLLTHHLAFDERLWSFTRALVELLASHPAVRLVSAATALSELTPPSSPRLTRGGEVGRGRSRLEPAT